MTLSNTLHRHQQRSKQPAGFDLIVAADVLVYFGSLHSLLQTISHSVNGIGGGMGGVGAAISIDIDNFE